MERDVAVKRSKSSRREKDRNGGGKGGGGGTGMEIKKNPTIISSAKNATTYVEDRTGTLVPEG